MRRASSRSVDAPRPLRLAADAGRERGAGQVAPAERGLEVVGNILRSLSRSLSQGDPQPLQGFNMF